MSAGTPEAYTVTLDDDIVVPKIIEKITELPSLAFVRADELTRTGPSLRPACAFIDINLGTKESGLDLIPQLREWWPDTPIIVITSGEDDEVIGQSLAVGANDFVRKPFRPRELMARMQTRIAEMQRRSRVEHIRVGESVLYIRQRRLQQGDSKSYLSPVESDLLLSLVEAGGTVVPKQDLKRKLWGDINVSDNALDRRISSLRRALKDVGEDSKIESIYGSGVRFKRATNV